MELSLSTKLRVAAAAAVGVLLIGILAWPLARPVEPFGAVRAVSLDATAKAVLVGLAFLCGLLGYFISWPHGREIGILAVPSGLAIWAVRSGSMASLMQQHPVLHQRQALLAALKFEPLFWLAIVAVGFVGVACGRRIISPASSAKVSQKPKSPLSTHLRGIAALAAAVFIAQICLGRLAQDVQVPDGRLGSVTAQPMIGQVVFGVIVSFGLAAGSPGPGGPHPAGRRTGAARARGHVDLGPAGGAARHPGG